MAREKISQADLKKLEKQRGTKVRRKMGAQPKPEPQVEAEVLPENEVVQPEKQVVPHASMAASMAAHEEEMRRIQAETDAKFAEIREQLVAIAAKGEASEYTFDLKRNDKDLLEKVFARPGIHE